MSKFEKYIPKSLLEAATNIMTKGEQIDELSKSTLKSYEKKATKQADKAWDKSSKEEDKAMSTDGEKYPEKQKRHNDAAWEHLKVWRKRDKGITLAKKKLKEEEELEEGTILSINDDYAEVVFESGVEHIALDDIDVSELSEEELDEISKNTVRSYYNKAGEEGRKARDQILIGGGDWSKDGSTTKTLKKRAKGREMALKRRRGELPMTKEEVEELDELSKNTLASYASKAVDHAGIENRFKYRDARTGDMNKAERREKGIKTAIKKLAKEEVENLDEVSKDTLERYKTNATAAKHSLETKRGRKSASDKKTIAKRASGLEHVKAKLEAIHKAESEKHAAQSRADHKELHNHFHKEAPGILKKHGYTKAADTEERSTWIKPHKSGHITTVTLDKRDHSDGHSPASHKLSSSTGWSGAHHYSHDHFWGSEEKKEVKKKMMPKFEAAIIHHHDNLDTRYDY